MGVLIVAGQQASFSKIRAFLVGVGEGGGERFRRGPPMHSTEKLMGKVRGRDVVWAYHARAVTGVSHSYKTRRENDMEHVFK